MDVTRTQKIKRLSGKGGIKLNKILDQYCDMLSHVKAEEGFEERLVDYLMEIQEKEKKNVQISSWRMPRPRYAYIMGMMILCVGIFIFRTPVAAQIKDIFEHFYETFSVIYEARSGKDRIDLNKEIITKSGNKIWLEDGVVTDRGITFRYEIRKKKNAREIYPDAVKVKLLDGTMLSFEECMYMPVSAEQKKEQYVVSFETKKREQLKKLKGKVIRCKLIFQEERKDSMKEIQTDISFPVKRIHSLKTIQTDQKWEKARDGTDYRITKLVEHEWYLEIYYQWKSKTDDFILFQMFDEHELEYMDLGATMNDVCEDTYSGVAYYELPKEKVNQLYFVPVKIKEVNGQEERVAIKGNRIIISGGDEDEK